MNKNDVVKLEDSFVRILDTKDDKYLVIDCKLRNMCFWINKKVIDSGTSISEEELLNELNINLKKFDELTNSEKKIVLDRYGTISSIVPVVSNNEERNRMIDECSRRYNLTKCTIRRRLCDYLSINDICIFLPSEKKIKKELLAFMKEDREGYEKFFANFGNQLKYGIYDNFGMNKDLLSDLILFTSSKDKKKVTLDEYIERMKDDQKYIYYAAGETVEKIDMLPQTKAAVDKGYEVLYFTDEIDEFSMKMMQSYKDKEFRSVADEDVSGDAEKDKEKIKAAEEENKELISFIKETIGDKISEVCVSMRLSASPCCLSSKGEISLEMEKTLNRMPGAGGVKADRVLEINPDSAVVAKVRETLASGDKATAASYARLLYDQAVLLSGLELDDPAALASDINSLINK